MGICGTGGSNGLTSLPLIPVPPRQFPSPRLFVLIPLPSLSFPASLPLFSRFPPALFPLPERFPPRFLQVSSTYIPSPLDKSEKNVHCLTDHGLLTSSLISHTYLSFIFNILKSTLTARSSCSLLLLKDYLRPGYLARVNIQYYET